jgi:AcrR family transcriptional regulator
VVGTATAARRTQVERTAATRSAVLDATIASLVDEGYARTTIRGIARRAAVTPGALQHHFADKRELVAEAVGHLNARLTQELVTQGRPASGDPRRLATQMLDRLWEIHRGPLIQALNELAVAGRTDPELRAHLLEAQRAADELTASAAALLFPGAVGPALHALIGTVLATMRGKALLSHLHREPDTTWPVMREHLLSLVSA